MALKLSYLPKYFKKSLTSLSYFKKIKLLIIYLYIIYEPTL